MGNFELFIVPHFFFSQLRPKYPSLHLQIAVTSLHFPFVVHFGTHAFFSHINPPYPILHLHFPVVWSHCPRPSCMLHSVGGHFFFSQAKPKFGA
jgi:hypothetical protein